MVKIRDILMKASNIFSTDMYLVSNQLLYAGNETMKESTGECLCRLNADAIECCQSMYKKDSIIYFSSVRGAKDDLETFSKELNDDEERTLKKSDSYNLVNKVLDIDTWDSFNFSDQEKQDLLSGNTITLFSENKKIPNTSLNKSMIPSLSSKNIDNIVYHVERVENEDIDEYYVMTLYLILDYFELYLQYKFISIEDKPSQ